MIHFKRILYFFCSSCRPNTSRTVRFAFPLLFVLAGFMGAAALVHENASYIRVESSTDSVSASEQFEVHVYAGAHVPVNAVDIAITYPESQIKIKGIDTGESVITIWTQEPYVDEEKVILRGGTFRKGFIGEHLIATIQAEAIKAGTADFDITSSTFLAGDGSGSEVAIAKKDGTSVSLLVENTDGTLDADITVIIVTDIDGDGEVGFDDVAAFMSAWRTRTVQYDFNKDNRMNFTDFAIILADSFTK